MFKDRLANSDMIALFDFIAPIELIESHPSRWNTYKKENVILSVRNERFDKLVCCQQKCVENAKNLPKELTKFDEQFVPRFLKVCYTHSINLVD